jgi:hypothetical protein
MLLPALAGAQPQEEPGAVLAPAILPEGESTTAIWAGVPELAVSMRQGLAGGGGEVEARAAFDYLLVSATLEGTARKQAGWFGGKLVPELGSGLKLNSGSRYAFSSNAAGVFLRVSPGLLLIDPQKQGYDSDPPNVYGVYRVALPLELRLNRPGAWRLLSKWGLGAEIRTPKKDLSFLALCEFGLGAAQEPGETVRFAGTFALSFGLGLRQF